MILFIAFGCSNDADYFFNKTISKQVVEGNKALMSGDYSKAKELYKLALVENPHDPLALNNMAELYAYAKSIR